MAAALLNLPGFLLGKYVRKDAGRFYKEQILFYKRRCGKDFLQAFEAVFTGEISDPQEAARRQTLELKKFCQEKRAEPKEYTLEIFHRICSQSGDLRALIFRRAEGCYQLLLEKLLYDEYTRAWHWMKSEGFFCTLVDSMERGEDIIREEFAQMDDILEGRKPSCC